MELLTKRSGSCSPTAGSTGAEAVDTFGALLDVMRRLQAAALCHRVQQLRDDALALEVAVPGERWAIESRQGGEVEIGVFRSSGEIQGAGALENLFRRCADWRQDRQRPADLTPSQRMVTAPPSIA